MCRFVPLRGNTSELEEKLAEEAQFYLNRLDAENSRRKETRLAQILRKSFEIFGVGN
jgi:hypothetical protein